MRVNIFLNGRNLIMFKCRWEELRDGERREVRDRDRRKRERKRQITDIGEKGE